jgi:hypothetical protein
LSKKKTRGPAGNRKREQSNSRKPMNVRTHRTQRAC